jgi:NAD(P)-dependent dehydrogenase (short-subunit alcohol dehydrogenase family)
MEWSPDRDALRGRVAVVAGATRGAGRGIAAALGEAGATVVCTGRTTRSTRSDYNRAETIEETAELVTHLGGTGVAAAVDHLDPDQVKRLADQIRKDHGHIDVLVNDIWGGELLKGGPTEWNTPIWEHDLDNGLRILRLAVDTHLITSHHLLPLLVDEPGGCWSR